MTYFRNDMQQRGRIAALEAEVEELKASRRHERETAARNINRLVKNLLKADSENRKKQAEIIRLNKWADSFSDTQLKERATAEEYQRELRGQIDAAQAREADAVKALEAIAAFVPKTAEDGVTGWKEWNRAGEYAAGVARTALNSIKDKVPQTLSIWVAAEALRPHAEQCVADLCADIQEGGTAGPELDMWNNFIAALNSPSDETRNILSIVNAAVEWRKQAKPRTSVACKLVYAIDAYEDDKDA